MVENYEKKFIVFLSNCLIITLCLFVFNRCLANYNLAHEDSVGLAYELDNGSYTVIGIGSCTDINIIIPETYEDKKVTKIKESAFKNCSNVKNIILPDTITEIGNNAFSGCINLIKITIPDNVVSLGHYAFWCCLNLKTAQIGYKVTKLDDSTFDCCKNLTEIKLPVRLKTIGNNCFSSCNSLKSITIPELVTEIGYGAFYRCLKLESVKFTSQKKWQVYSSANYISVDNEANNIIYLTKTYLHDVWKRVD